MAASLATIMFAARVLEKEEIGAYFLIMVIVQFAVTLGDIGLRNASIRFLTVAEGDEIGSVTRYLLTINGLAAGLACLVLALVLPLLIKLWPSRTFPEIAWYSVPIVFLTINFQMGLAVLAGHKLFGAMSVITAAIEILRMVISLGALYLGYGASGLLLSMLLSRVVGLVLVWREMPFSWKPVIRHERIGEILKFSGWMYGASLMSVVNMRAADAVIASHMGIAALANYSTAMQVPAMLQKIFESIRPVVLGYVSSLKLDAAHASIAASRLLAGLLTIGAAILMAVADPLVVLLFSSRYQDSAPIMQALCAWMAIGIVNYYLGITLIGMGHSRKVFLLLLPQFVVMLGASILLIPLFQGIGAAVSLILTAVTGNVINCWMVANGDKKLFALLNFAFLRSVIPLLLLLAILLLGRPSVLVSIAFSLAIISAVFLLRAITLHDLKFLRRQIFS